MLHLETIRLNMNILEFLTQLTAKGYCTFTSAQVKETLNLSEIAARAALRRLKQKGMLAQPLHGFYVIVPPEYRILGCRPAEHFITDLMEYIGAPYYVGLLTAAQYYGAAHHKPQQYQVVTNQKRRAIICGRVKIVFITKKAVEEVPTQKINAPQTIITASTPEATAIDLILYANRCGGLDNVLAVLTDLVEKINSKKLMKLASESKEVTWIQRLGYILDLIKAEKLSEDLEKEFKHRGGHVRTLMAAQKPKQIIKFDKKIISKVHKKNAASNSLKDKKWKLIINKKLESEI